MEKQQQTFANHAKFDVLFHFVLSPIALAQLIVAIVRVVRVFSLGSVWILVLSFAGVIVVLRMRSFAMGLQDRIVRLEERIRLGAVLQEPLRSRINELSTDQLIGLRFASDAELPGLVKRALDEKLGRADIKKAVTNWQPDFARV